MAAQMMNTGGLPRGELLGRYRSYEDAQKVVDHLAGAEGLDIKAISIVGNDLRSVEYIRSRLSYPRVAGAGAAQGAMFGFFIGLLIFLFAPEAPVLNLVLSVVLGMAIWMIIGVVGYAVRRGQRDFASSSQLVATTYDVVCDFSVAGKARQLVTGAGVQSLNAWNDPTGKSANLGGAPAPAPQQGSAAPATASAPAAQNADEGSAAPSSPKVGYHDLPDGRPRFGARREDDQKADDAPTHDGTPGETQAAAPATYEETGPQPEPESSAQDQSSVEDNQASVEDKDASPDSDAESRPS